MSIRRAVVYIGGASLLLAWFSSAASLSIGRAPEPAAAADAQPTSPVDGLAGTIEAQARRLRTRLAAAPPPQQPARNPFAFRPSPPPQSRQTARRTAEPSSAAPPVIPPEPPLTLIGMAEQHAPEGRVRTAMIATQGEELIMAGVGDRVLEQYTVTAIGADAVELTDTATGAVRRLILP